MQKLLYIAIALLFLCLSIFGWYTYQLGQKVREPIALQDIVASLPVSSLNASYNIDGVEVQLVDGTADTEIVPGSASRSVTSVWGDEQYLDVNGDGHEDAVLVLTQSGGGSGTFYYLAVAVSDGVGYLGSEAVFLGDRIEMQSVTFLSDVIRVQYAERIEGDMMAEVPTVGVTRYFTVQGAQIHESTPDTEDATVFAGVLQEGMLQYMFTPCADEMLYIATTSPAYVVLDAVYAQQMREVQGGTSVFAVLAGMQEEDEGKNEFWVTAVLTASGEGVCPPFRRRASGGGDRG